MTTPTAGFTRLLTDEEAPTPARAGTRRVARQPAARAILLEAALLGVAADALLRPGLTGLGFVLWMILAATTAVALLWRDDRRVTAETGGWLAVAVLAAAGMAWRDSELLQVADFATALGALLMAAISASDATRALFASRLRDLMLAAARVLGAIVAGVLPLLRPAFGGISAQSPARGRIVAGARAAVIVAGLAVVFGGLLSSADPVFAALFRLPELDLGEALSHLFLIGVFTWLAAGWSRAALVSGVGAPSPERFPVTLSRSDVTAALGTLTVLFATYVVAQVGWLFGGERFLQERVGLTAAQYARYGFFEMVWVVVLALPVLLVTRAAIGTDRDGLRRHTVLALPIVALLAIMVISAALRMRLYVQYFGLTTERIYPMVFMAWLAFVLVWTAATVLRGRGQAFVSGAVVSGLLTLAALHLASPDQMVARYNTTRAPRAMAADATRPQDGVDAVHLAGLGGEAVPTVVDWLVRVPLQARADSVRPELRSRCSAAARLLRDWGPASAAVARTERPGAWRAWNAGEGSAMRAVATRGPALRAVAHQCPRPPRSSGATR